MTERALRESLLAAFMDVCDVVIKAQFIVHDDAGVLKALHHFHWLVVDGSGALGRLKVRVTALQRCGDPVYSIIHHFTLVRLQML